jgi:hypothetical protein
MMFACERKAEVNAQLDSLLGGEKPQFSFQGVANDERNMLTKVCGCRAIVVRLDC